MAATPPHESWFRGSNRSPLFQALGVRAEDISEGYARYRVEPVPASVDGDGVLDSLAITTAADQAVVACVSTVIDPRREAMNGTAEMNLTYVARPTGAVQVDARIVHKGPHLAVVDLEVRDESGALVARGRGSYATRPLDHGAPR